MEILQIQGVDVEGTVAEQIRLPQHGVASNIKINKDSRLADKSLLDDDFRKRFGVAVMAIEREAADTPKMSEI